MPAEFVNLNQSKNLDNSDVEGALSKLGREAHLILGGLTEGSYETAQQGFSSEHWTRTAVNAGLAAALTIAMRRPGIFGNVARGVGTLGAANFALDLASPRRIDALSSAMKETWASPANFNSSYAVVKKELGTVGFDTIVAMGGAAVGSGLASRFIKPLAPEVLSSPREQKMTTPSDKLIEAPKVLTQEPLNVLSRSNEPLGRALSNFAHTPFMLDGVKYASVEAFYQGLKFLDAAKRAEIAPLYGSYAKSAAKKAPKLGETTYLGEQIKLGSPQHHALMERAIRAKIEQNPQIRDGLLESQNRQIVHDTGHGLSMRKSNFPDTVFADMLAKIRQDLAGSGKTPSSGLNLAALEAIEVKGGKSDLVKPATRDTVTGADKITPLPLQGEVQLTTVSEALSSITKPRLHDFHNLKDYASAFEGFDRKVSKVIGGGSDSVVLRLQDGNVLKITTHELPPDLGKRVFDLPVLEQGSRMIDGRSINYFVQPYAQQARPADLHAIGESIKLSGYHFQEPFLNQVGRYQGRPFLLDPWAVRKY